MARAQKIYQVIFDDGNNVPELIGKSLERMGGSLCFGKSSGKLKGFAVYRLLIAMFR